MAHDAAPQKFSGSQRAAIFLLTLGEESAAAVFAKMSPDELQRIAAAMMQLKNIDDEAKKSVLNAFLARLGIDANLL